MSDLKQSHGVLWGRLAGPPAVKAWLAFAEGAGEPDTIEVLRDGKESAAYRLLPAGRGGGAGCPRGREPRAVGGRGGGGRGGGGLPAGGRGRGVVFPRGGGGRGGGGVGGGGRPPPRRSNETAK